VVTDCDVDVFTSSVLTGSCSYVLIDWVSSQQPPLLCLTRSGWGGFAYSLDETSMKMRRRPSLILADIVRLASRAAHSRTANVWICILSSSEIKFVFKRYY